jgi:Xaa-Pro dipeptidase
VHDYRARQQRVYQWLAGRACGAAVLVDFEGMRDRSLRYLSGHVGDALLFLFGAEAAEGGAGESLLVPWDLPLAERLATVDRLVAYQEYDRRLEKALEAILTARGVGSVELTGRLPFPLVERLKAALPAVKLSCREEGLDAFLAAQRAVKDQEELVCIRRACRITDELLALVEERLGDPRGVSEVQMALLLEAEARDRGAEGMSFETLAAGASRSFGIHCFPAVTGGPFASPGLSILDFGVSFAGYASDVTTTVLRGALSPGQQKMHRAVEEAYTLAVSRCRPGVATTEIAGAVTELFASRGLSMPHGLGHGVGLDNHEEPFFRSRDAGGERADPPRLRPGMPFLRPGMVITIEPGLYDPGEGGIRLENDVLVTETGCEVLTSSHLISLG